VPTLQYLSQAWYIWGWTAGSTEMIRSGCLDAPADSAEQVGEVLDELIGEMGRGWDVAATDAIFSNRNN